MDKKTMDKKIILNAFVLDTTFYKCTDKNGKPNMEAIIKATRGTNRNCAPYPDIEHYIEERLINYEEE